MSIKKRNVSVHQIPSNMSSTSEIALIRALATAVENGHPRFVLDCSRLESVGSSEMHLLLCCLEQAMKNNGDVRLAGLPPQARAALSQAGISRLFELYETTEHAVRSYQLRTASLAPLSFETVDLDTEYAA